MRNLIIAAVTAVSALSWAGSPDSIRDTGPYAVMPTADVIGLNEKAPKFRANVTGWVIDSSDPAHYELRCDRVYTDCRLAVLRSKPGVAPDDVAAMLHAESAVPYRGRRVELRIEMKAGNVGGWLGAFVRIDDEQGRRVRLDDMNARPIRATSGFEWYSVVVDVPLDAERLTIGAALHGDGAVIIREVSFASADLRADSR